MPAPFFVDSFAPLTDAAVSFLLAKSGGVMPLAWGRYIDADLSRDLDVAAAHGIPLLLIARRSSRVPLGHDAGALDGAADRARFEHWVEVAKAKGASVLRSVFLDVEQTPTLSDGYWRGWSKAFDSHERDGETVPASDLTPCAYMPNRNNWPASWVALESAITAGARCGGTWVALYHQPVDGSAVLRHEPWTSRPKASDVVPYLAWQDEGNAYGSRYDFSEPNPDASDWLADVVGARPVAEVAPCAVAIDAPVQLAAQEGRS